MVELLMASDDLSKEEMDEIKKIQDLDDKQTLKYEQSLESCDKDEKKKLKDLEKELEKEDTKRIRKK